MPAKEIKIVKVGKYVAAFKSGRCPLFAVEDVSKEKDMREGLKEDFPDYALVRGGEYEKAEVAKRIIMRQKMGGR